VVDKEIRTINRAIAEVEDQDVREAARTSLHHVYQREVRKDNEIVKLRGHIERAIRLLDKNGVYWARHELGKAVGARLKETT
jgi:hypothetical protein